MQLTVEASKWIRGIVSRFRRYDVLKIATDVFHSGFEHQITKGSECHRPDPALGGILADVMGLGKTLTVLAGICSTLEQARQSVSQLNHLVEDSSLYRSMSTLVVVPSSRKYSAQHLLAACSVQS